MTDPPPPYSTQTLGLGKIGEERPVDFSITKWPKNLSRKQESGRREFGLDRIDRLEPLREIKETLRYKINEASSLLLSA